MKTITVLKNAKLYSLAAINGFVTGLIQVEKSFFQSKIVVLDSALGLGLLLSYLFKLFLEEHLHYQALATDLFDLDIRLDQVDGAFMAIIVLSLVGAFKYASFLWMVDAGKDTEACLFLHALHELSINQDCILLLLGCMSLIDALFLPIPVRIMCAIIAHLLDCSRSGHP